MNKAERIKIANAEWHRLNDISKEIDVCLSKLIYETSSLEHYERKYSGYWVERSFKEQGKSYTKPLFQNGQYIHDACQLDDWYDLKLKRCNALLNKIEMLIESKGV